MAFKTLFTLFLTLSGVAAYNPGNFNKKMDAAFSRYAIIDARLDDRVVFSGWSSWLRLADTHISGTRSTGLYCVRLIRFDVSTFSHHDKEQEADAPADGFRVDADSVIFPSL